MENLNQKIECAMLEIKNTVSHDIYEKVIDSFTDLLDDSEYFEDDIIISSEDQMNTFVPSEGWHNIYIDCEEGLYFKFRLEFSECVNSPEPGCKEKCYSVCEVISF